MSINAHIHDYLNLSQRLESKTQGLINKMLSSDPDPMIDSINSSLERIYILQKKQSSLIGSLLDNDIQIIDDTYSESDYLFVYGFLSLLLGFLFGVAYFFSL